MSVLLDECLKDLSKDLNLFQTKRKEYVRKYDFDSKSKVLKEMTDIINKAKLTFNRIEREIEMVSPNVRRDNKGAVEAVRIELNKAKVELSKLDQQLKADRLIDKSADNDYDNDSDKKRFIANKIEKNTNNLSTANNMANNIIDTNKNTVIELQNQRQRINNVNRELGEVENKLTLLGQVFDVMKNKELYNKLKLVLIVALLGLANLIVLYIKLK